MSENIDKQDNDAIIAQLQKRVVWLENRCQRLERAVFPHYAIQPGEGQKQIQSTSDRTESGMGPILNTGSEFI